MKRLAMLSAGAATLAISRFALAGPEGGSGYGFPRDVSVEGWRIDWLINVTMIFVVLLFLIMCIWMGLAMWKHGESHKAEYDHGNAKKQVVFACSLSAVIFFVVDGNLFVNSIIDLDEAFWNFEKAEKHPDAVRIELNAHQWAWDVRYAGPDGVFDHPGLEKPSTDDVVLLNDIRVPVGRPVIFQMASVDVLHSLYLPNMRVKKDVVPGNITYTKFTAKDTGHFEIACAQHCGIHHYKMKGDIYVLPADEFDAWLEEASENSAASYDSDDVEAHWGWNWEENKVAY